MTILKTDKITRTVALTFFIFLVLFFGLEYGLSLFFTQKTSEILERGRQEEFRQSWNQYFEQRKAVLITGLDGYANWSFLSDNILNGNDKVIEQAFSDYVETLQQDYLIDFMLIKGMNRNLVFGFFDNLTTKNELKKINSLRESSVEDYCYKETQKIFEVEKKKCEVNPGTRSKVWTSILQFHNEIFLISYSYIADDNGLLVSPNAIMVVGVRMSKILQMASKVIPGKFEIHLKETLQENYLDIVEKGFFPGEKFYVSFTPNQFMKDIIKQTVFWMMLVQIALIFILILFIFPISVKFYTRQLQEVIDAQTLELTGANEKQSKLIKHLQAAFASIRSLEGLIPICASCKRIRNDKGYWEQVEEYIQQHSEANFSHGICPECIKKLYPDVAAKKEKMEKKRLEKQDPPLPLE